MRALGVAALPTDGYGGRKTLMGGVSAAFPRFSGGRQQIGTTPLFRTQRERNMRRHGYIIGGQVQGVGFRPFVYRAATRHGLTGHVGNTSDGVRVEVQGSDEALAAFAHALEHGLPPLARITSLRREELPLADGETAFAIAHSEGRHGHAVLVSPDVATCGNCLADMRDPANRRYRYPFTNCTDCGPRYTITRSIPYDRATTSMSCFPLCPDCAAEYNDPLDRRFHAQPNACPACGPKVWLAAAPEGDPRIPGPELAEGQHAIERTAAALRAGNIVAVKGLGGFHLVCDAASAEAVALLRERKRRPHKSLAIMVPDLETARRVAHVSDAEAAALTSSERPIVVLASRGVLPPAIAPDVDSIGVMLPYTPLHHLLLEAFAALSPLPALVMTSGNAGGEPISLGNREALARLRHIADLFLLHNRDILIRADDSVVRVESLPETSFFHRQQSTMLSTKKRQSPPLVPPPSQTGLLRGFPPLQPKTLKGKPGTFLREASSGKPPRSTSSEGQGGSCRGRWSSPATRAAAYWPQARNSRTRSASRAARMLSSASMWAI